MNDDGTLLAVMVDEILSISPAPKSTMYRLPEESVAGIGNAVT